MKLAKVILLLSACALIGACNKGANTNNAGASGNTSNAGSTAAASPKATAEAPKSTAETAAKISKPEDAAQGLFNAWKTKDRTAAAKFATNAAITHLFSEGGPEGLQFQGCEKQGDSGYNCGYSYEGGGLIMMVDGSAADGYKVIGTSFIAD